MQNFGRSSKKCLRKPYDLSALVYADAFHIRGCNSLQGVLLGENCFKRCMNPVIEDCAKLEVISLSEETFGNCDDIRYEGRFLLKSGCGERC